MYHLLGNDVEDDSAPSLPPKEIVKKNTSSKKTDTPPASADPAKAKKKTNKATGNEAALKNKLNNKSVNAPASTPSKSTKKPFDRHSRTNRTDTKKKLKQGWGDNDAKRELEAETEGLQDAVAELAEEDEAEPAKPAGKSLQEYFEELKLQQQEISSSKTLRKANEGAEQKWSSEEQIVKEQEVFVPSTSTKKAKSKAQKEKKFLEIDAVFADEQPKPAFNKGGKKPFAGKKPFGGKPKSGKTAKPEVNDKNFPSL